MAHKFLFLVINFVSAINFVSGELRFIKITASKRKFKRRALTTTQHPEHRPGKIGYGARASGSGSSGSGASEPWEGERGSDRGMTMRVPESQSGTQLHTASYATNAAHKRPGHRPG